MPVLFELKELTVSGIINQLNLQLKPGMTVLFKTSGEQESHLLLQVLLGESAPETGEVLFDGQPMNELSREELLKTRRAIGIVAAQTNLISNLKLWENITLPLLYHHGTLSSEAADQAMQLLASLGLNKSLWVLPGHLSRAERIMVAFVRAVISSPRMMVYATCLDDLPGLQRETLMQLVVQIQHQSDAPAAIFISAGDLQLPPQLQPDMICDLKQNPAQVTRRL